MLPLLAAATAGYLLLRGKRRNPRSRRSTRRRRVSRNPDNIVYQKGDFHVVPARKGYEIYKHAGTHAVKVATIGFEGEKGIAWAVKEIDRRLALKSNPISPELHRIIEHTLKLAKRGRWKAAWQHAGDAQRLIIDRPELREYRGDIIELRNMLKERKLEPRWTNPPKAHQIERRAHRRADREDPHNRGHGLRWFSLKPFKSNEILLNWARVEHKNNPLKRGLRPSVISGNIRKLIREGRSQKQAVAIALSTARRSAVRRGKGRAVRRLRRNPTKVQQFERLWSTYITKLARIDELKAQGRHGFQLRMPKKALRIAADKLRAWCKENGEECPI